MRIQLHFETAPDDYSRSARPDAEGPIGREKKGAEITWGAGGIKAGTMTPGVINRTRTAGCFLSLGLDDGKRPDGFAFGGGWGGVAASSAGGCGFQGGARRARELLAARNDIPRLFR